MALLAKILPARLGARTWLALVFAFLYGPIACVVFFSFTSGEITTRFDGFSLRWYAALVDDDELRAAAALSLRIAASAASAAVVLGCAAALVLVRLGRGIANRLLAGLTAAPMVLPDVVIGLALVLLFTQPLLGTAGGRGVVAIWAAHTTLCAAYVSVVVASRLREMDRSLEEAAMTLGCPPWRVFFVITIPVIAPSLVASWLLAFTLSMDDFVLAAMLSDPGSTTLPVLIFARLHHGLKPEINALATVIVAVVVVLVAAVTLAARQLRARKGRR